MVLMARGVRLVLLPVLLAACSQAGSSSGSSGPEVGTASATLRPTAEPTAVPDFAFEPVVVSGTGNGVPRFSIPDEAAAIADITHSGSANFTVWTVDAAGSEQDLLVNTIGTYQGTVLFDDQAGQHSVAFTIEADGAWTITVKPISEATVWDTTADASGRGDDVLVLNPPSSGLKTVTITHRGVANFAIWAYSGANNDLLVNEIGIYTGESLLTDGTFLLEITADGTWTITSPA